MFANKLNTNPSGTSSPLTLKPNSLSPAFPSVDATTAEFQRNSNWNSITSFGWNKFMKRNLWLSMSSSPKCFRFSLFSPYKEEGKKQARLVSSGSSLMNDNGGGSTGSEGNARMMNPASSSSPQVPEPKKSTNACNRSLSDIHAPTWLGLLVCNTFIRVSLFHPLQLSLARKRVVQEKSPPSVFRWIAAAYRGGARVLPGMKTPIDFGPGGIRGMYRGYGAAFLSGMTSSIVYLFTMETLKENLIKGASTQSVASMGGDVGEKGSENQFTGHRWATAAGATCADALTLCIVTPIAVVVGRQMTSGVGLAADNPYRSIFGTFRHLWHLHQPRAEERLRRRAMGASAGLGNRLWSLVYWASAGKVTDRVLECGGEGLNASSTSTTIKSKSSRNPGLTSQSGVMSVENRSEHSHTSSSSSSTTSSSKSRVSSSSSSSSRAVKQRSLRMPISTGAAAATTRVSSFSSISALSGATAGSNPVGAAVVYKKSTGSSLLSFFFPNSHLTPSSSRSSAVSSLGRQHVYSLRRNFWYTVYGFRGLYQGLSAALLRIPFSGVWWASYTTAKETFYSAFSPTLRHLQATHSTMPGASWIFSPCDNLLLNALASASASVMTTLMASPLSVLQVRLQVLSTSTTTEASSGRAAPAAGTGSTTKSSAVLRGGNRSVHSPSAGGSGAGAVKKVGGVTLHHHHTPRSGLLQMASDIVRKEGIRGFYKGASTNISIAILDGMVFSILFEVTRMLSDVNYGANKNTDALFSSTASDSS